MNETSVFPSQDSSTEHNVKKAVFFMVERLILMPIVTDNYSDQYIPHKY